LGRHAPQSRFPLLFKFLDCRDRLSVQVHPTDRQAATCVPPDLGKTEAWLILDVEPGSVIYAGLKRGFDRAALEREIARGTCELCLHRFEPRPGDCLFLPAGMVHAPGAGLLMAEIQQASDTTFRLFDWNRVGADGRPRTLHIEQGLAAINYDFGPASPQAPQPTADPRIATLVECDKFVWQRIACDGAPLTLPTDDRFRVVAVIGGDVELRCGEKTAVLRRGETCLVPAACPAASLVGPPGAVAVSAHLP
jgi:mannose-6-phosphate isomerase